MNSRNSLISEIEASFQIPELQNGEANEHKC
jgi:hypothetical protein